VRAHGRWTCLSLATPTPCGGRLVLGHFPAQNTRADGVSKHGWKGTLLPPSHRRGPPANTQAPPSPNAAGIRTQLSSYQTAPTEYSGQRYRRGRRLTAFRPPVAQDHAHFCHEHAAAQQPGQDPRNTPKVATQASAARLGPAAAACTSLFARKNQELRGRTKSAQIQDKRARAGADGRELRDTPLRLGDPDK
jgi:hypothetical protein